MYTMLYVVATVAILAGLFYSFRDRARQKTEIDRGIDPAARGNPIYGNPIFWAFLLGFVVIMGLVWAFKLYYRTPF